MRGNISCYLDINSLDLRQQYRSIQFERVLHAWTAACSRNMTIFTVESSHAIRPEMQARCRDKDLMNGCFRVLPAMLCPSYYPQG